MITHAQEAALAALRITDSVLSIGPEPLRSELYTV